MLKKETDVPRLNELPIEDRLRLVEELWDSIAAEQENLPLTSSQKEELDRRLAALEADGLIGRPFREVVDDIRRRL